VNAKGTIQPKFTDDVPRLLLIRNAVLDLVESYKIESVVFEDFSFGSKGQALFQIGGLAYMVRAELFDNNRIPFYLVSPAALKKFIVGRSGSPGKKGQPGKPVTKEMVIREVWRRWSIEVNDNNEADAVGLSYIGMALAGDWEPTMDAQIQVLDVLKKKGAQHA
jgi:hypothetical protein